MIGNIATKARLDEQFDEAILKEFLYGFLTQPDFNKTYLAIEQHTGIIRTVERIDRDLICPQQVHCTAKFDVAVRPMEYFRIIKVSVEIFDVNDNKPRFPERRVEFDISESTLTGTSFSLPAARDPDSGANGIQEYKLISSTDKFNLSQSRSADGATDLRLILHKKLNREHLDHYGIRVVAQDHGDPPKSGVIEVKISVLDANDNDPKFDNATYEAFVMENTPIGTTIAKVRATDPDSGINGDVYYQFEKHTQKDYGHLFEIEPEVGSVVITGSLDYESAAIYLLSVSAHDKGPDSLPSSTQVVVRIGDMNDNAPEISVNTLTKTGMAQVLENLKPDTFVAYISVLDKDNGNNGKVTCSLNDNVNFRLEKLYMTEYKVVTERTFDREMREQYEFSIMCRDHGLSPQTSFSTIKVNVLDENDHSPQFTSRIYSAIIEENNMVGAMLTRVSAPDRDSGLNGQVTYELAKSGEGILKVDPKTGVVTADDMFDYEKSPKIETQVIARDKGNPPRSATCTVQVQLMDIDDEKPQFTEVTYGFGTYENQPKNTEVGTVVAVDADAHPHNRFHYYLDPEHSPMDTFDIDPDTGTIRTKKVLDREKQAVYFLTALAIPQDDPHYSSTATVSVYVADQNDNPPVFEFPSVENRSLSIAGNAPLGYVIVRLRAHDADSGMNAQLTYHITEGNLGDEFALDANTGALCVNKELLPSMYKSFTLKITIKDSGESSLSTSAYIRVHVTAASTFPKARAHSLLAEENLTIILAFTLASVLVMIFIVIAIVVLLRRRQRQTEEPEPREKQKMLLVERTEPPLTREPSDPNITRYVSHEEMNRLRSPKKEANLSSGQSTPVTESGSEHTKTNMKQVSSLNP